MTDNNIATLFNSFSNIVYIDDGHKYIDLNNNEQYTSVTIVLNGLKEKFDNKFWTVYKAFEFSGVKVKNNWNGTLTINDDVIINPYFEDLERFNLSVTPDQVAKQWLLDSKIGKTRGSLIHEYLENLLKRKQVNIQIPQFVQHLSAAEAINYIKSIDILKNMANEFVEQITKSHTVIAQEFVTGDSDYKIAGTFDLLLLNKETNKFELWDFKTDKKFEKKGRNKLQFFGFDDCELNKYSLQLGIYKHLLQKNTGIEISGCYVAYFNFKNNIAYEVYKCLNYDNEIQQFLENGKNKSTYF